jgi:hypothetical protein
MTSRQAGKDVKMQEDASDPGIHPFTGRQLYDLMSPADRRG